MRVQPVVSDRTVVPARALAGRSGPARWERVAIASAKQCGRAIVPEIASAVPLRDWLPGVEGCRCLLVEPAAVGAHRVSEPPGDAPATATLLVGPEGGWSPEEAALAAAAGWTLWSLGGLTLRAESAPLAALSILRWLWH